jgi:hypothetical protein
MSHKVILRSYSCFLHFLHLIFGGKWFLQLCPKLPSFVEKPQGILGVKGPCSDPHSPSTARHKLYQPLIPCEVPNPYEATTLVMK